MEQLQKAIEMRRDGNILESIKILESIPDKNGRIYFEWAWNYSVLDNANEAIKYYKLAIELELPKELKQKAYMDLGFNYFSLRRYEEAEQILSKGIGTFNDSEAFRAMRAVVRYKLGDSREGMIDLMQLLLELIANPSKEIAKYRTELMHYVQQR